RSKPGDRQIRKFGSVKLLVNGRTVATPRGFKIVKADTPNEKIIDYEVVLIAPENKISIYAENANASIVSEERVLSVSNETVSNNRNPDDSDLLPDVQEFILKPNLYMISVGVSGFKNQNYNLEFADDDATTIAEIFRTQKVNFSGGSGQRANQRAGYPRQYPGCFLLAGTKCYPQGYGCDLHRYPRL
ncbi:MAG: hypothetical protein HC880_13545, partial [Bacteroidia bacterium]|nr:hypothetical protein [Bacteroidia bacterium]